jgi:putative flippase GtrA
MRSLPALVKAQLEARGALIRQFIKFGTVGFFGFFVDLGFFHVGLDILGFGHYGSALFSFPIAASFNWMGNRHFTFRGRHEGSAHAQWMRFLMVCGVGVVLNRGTFSILTATVPLVYQYPVLGLLAGTGAGMFFNFFLSKKMVFR